MLDYHPLLDDALGAATVAPKPAAVIQPRVQLIHVSELGGDTLGLLFKQQLRTEGFNWCYLQPSDFELTINLTKINTQTQTINIGNSFAVLTSLSARFQTAPGAYNSGVLIRSERNTQTVINEQNQFVTYDIGNQYNLMIHAGNVNLQIIRSNFGLVGRISFLRCNPISDDQAVIIQGTSTFKP